ncbi:hypothetical protein CEXT_177421 [Caerostris extrusa]|uniref:Uncharacterized protein n=1 Tax=Caerostris extrusa TaxID=172846 RepID=A0AAV4M8M9_CAEEX|nr:hypothetical protein CEXT_177421 [Caerostris extrusa]
MKTVRLHYAYSPICARNSRVRSIEGAKRVPPSAVTTIPLYVYTGSILRPLPPHEWTARGIDRPPQLMNQRLAHAQTRPGCAFFQTATTLSTPFSEFGKKKVPFFVFDLRAATRL